MAHLAAQQAAQQADFSVGSEPWRRLTPGTFVHARVNLRDRTEVTVAPAEPPAVAGPLADVADQQRAASPRAGRARTAGRDAAGGGGEAP
jgi:hypothetical protein